LKKKESSDSERQYYLAIYLVLPAFALIAIMLYMQHMLNAEFVSIVKNYSVPPTKDQTENIINIIQEVDKSNQTIFNILLPVFGAWIGAVVAYFFGAASQKKTQESIEAVMKINKSEQDITVRELMDRYVESKDREIIKCTFDDNLKNVEESLKKFGNVVIHENNLPKGVLYKGDLYESDEKWDNTKTLGTFIDDSTVLDQITGKEWTRDGVKNYAVISYDDLVSIAKTKMDSIKENNPNLLGIVLEGGKIAAVVNYETIAKAYS